MWSFYKLMCLTSVQASGTMFGNFLTKEGKTKQVTAGNLFWQMEVCGGVGGLCVSERECVYMEGSAKLSWVSLNSVRIINP